MTQERGIIIAVALLALALVFGAFAILTDRPTPVEIVLIPPAPTPTPAPSAVPPPITVYVTGAVMNPQSTLTLPAGSRVQDAISAAGGLLDDADLDRINLAGILRDGDQIHAFSTQDRMAASGIPTPNNAGIVSINSATLEELVTLPGIGPAIAERIIAYREANGRIIDYTDLNNVSGIGPALIERLQGLVAFD